MSWIAGEVAGTLIQKLSLRQREVLRLVCRGLTNQEIGTVLCISIETVRTHMQVVLRRLGAGNRTEAAAICLAYDAMMGRAPQ